MLPFGVFDFQDSEVSSAELKDDQFVIRFSAAHARNKKDEHAGSEFLQALELTIYHPTIIEKESGCIGRVSQGSLRVAGTTIKNVPIPYEVKEKVELELIFSNGSMCKVSGQHVTLKPTGEMHFVEWLKC